MVAVYLAKRMLLLIPTFLCLTAISFFLIHLVPGDPVIAMVGGRSLTPEQHASALAAFGLDRPMHVQYLSYLDRVLQGDLGTSFLTREKIFDQFFKLFPATLELTIISLLLAVLIGIPAGILAAVKRDSFIDFATMSASLIGYCMPLFWWGLLLILLFSVHLGWTPVSGRISAQYFVDRVTGFMLIDSLLSDEKGAFVSAVRHLVLPAITLSLGSVAVIARMMRSAMIEILSEDYIRTARAKGLGTFRVINVHALRNALIPVVTVTGLQLDYLLGGAILTETIFAWPGIGKWLVDAIYKRDYPVIQASILIISLMVVLVNLSVDVLYSLLDPRIRARRA